MTYDEKLADLYEYVHDLKVSDDLQEILRQIIRDEQVRAKGCGWCKGYEHLKEGERTEKRELMRTSKEKTYTYIERNERGFYLKVRFGRDAVSIKMNICPECGRIVFRSETQIDTDFTEEVE